ncbi:aldo/keto reductase [Roseivirga sp. UBA1976]|uniref:aldo/keto reductase n=1 Tax=Roseivirga sp. UBA1976 TaxID=1947386 RepID=UPI0025794F57|nr:aldo/keto reductase [Roseivirga sp. UBA1976]
MNQLTFRNGDKIDAIGLGTWKSEPGEVYNAVREAIKIGYRHIDCAWIYKNEKEIGQAFADAFAEGDVTREELFVTSKLWNTYHHPNDVEENIRETLQDLQLDYLDLYLMHWPVAVKKGVGFPEKADDFISLEEIPLIDTWKAMEKLVDLGLTRHIGVSNFNIPKLQELIKEARIVPEMNQVESHPLLAQTELLEFCKKHDILYTAYSPLGSRDRSAGMKNNDEPDMFKLPRIQAIAKNHGVHPAQILIKWAEARGTCVIPKSVNPQRLKANLESANIPLSDYEIMEINKLDMGYRYIDGKFWEREGGPYTAESLWND